MVLQQQLEKWLPHTRSGKTYLCFQAVGGSLQPGLHGAVTEDPQLHDPISRLKQSSKITKCKTMRQQLRATAPQVGSATPGVCL